LRQVVSDALTALKAMEVNKDEALRCVEVARKYFDSGDYERAKKFISKSLGMFPTGTSELEHMTDALIVQGHIYLCCAEVRWQILKYLPFVLWRRRSESSGRESRGSSSRRGYGQAGQLTGAFACRS
jgi:hypothetical protein